MPILADFLWADYIIQNTTSSHLDKKWLIFILRAAIG